MLNSGKHNNNYRIILKSRIFIEIILRLTVANYIKQLLSYQKYSFSLIELIENINKTETSINMNL